MALVRTKLAAKTSWRWAKKYRFEASRRQGAHRLQAMYHSFWPHLKQVAPR